MSDYKPKQEHETETDDKKCTCGSRRFIGDFCQVCGKCQTERNQEAKADAGKLMLELIPPEALEALGRVLTHGAKKYGANKWQNIDDAKERYKGALLRHYTAYQKNNAGTDPDSGLLHIEHLFCNAMFLAVLELRENGGKVI